MRKPVFPADMQKERGENSGDHFPADDHTVCAAAAWTAADGKAAARRAGGVGVGHHAASVRGRVAAAHRAQHPGDLRRDTDSDPRFARNVHLGDTDKVPRPEKSLLAAPQCNNRKRKASSFSFETLL